VHRHTEVMMCAIVGGAMNSRILVVDDERPILDLVRGYLEREGFTVSTAEDGPAAIERVRTERPDVVVLDVMLPGLDGFEVLRQMRTFSDAYVLMLTARGEEVDRVVGLSVGADDYLVKPFSPRELVARVKVLLRRPRAAPPSPPGDLVVDVARRTVTVRGTAVALTATEFDILALLARDPGVVVGRGELLAAVWGSDFVGDDHVVDVHVANLRRKVGGRSIETVRGVGYKLADR
jgi:two-component system, OmpR family, alkaline phosphatase synthesis response regulator PhoP